MNITVCRATSNPEEWTPEEGELLPDLAPHLANVATWVLCDVGIQYIVVNVETGHSAASDYDPVGAKIKAKERLAAIDEARMLGIYAQLPERWKS